MEGKGGFFILIIIVAFLSLAIALLGGYVFFVSGSSNGGESATVINNPIAPVPKDEELSFVPLLDEKMNFNLKSSDGKISIIQVDGEMSYYIKVKGIKDVAAKIALYKSEIKELVGTYFQGLTLDDVKAPEAKEKAKKALVKQINDLLNKNEQQKNDIIYNIVFSQWFYQ